MPLSAPIPNRKMTCENPIDMIDEDLASFKLATRHDIVQEVFSYGSG